LAEIKKGNIGDIGRDPLTALDDRIDIRDYRFITEQEAKDAKLWKKHFGALSGWGNGQFNDALGKPVVELLDMKSFAKKANGYRITRNSGMTFRVKRERQGSGPGSIILWERILVKIEPDPIRAEELIKEAMMDLT